MLDLFYCSWTTLNLELAFKCRARNNAFRVWSVNIFQDSSVLFVGRGAALPSLENSRISRIKALYLASKSFRECQTNQTFLDILGGSRVSKFFKFWPFSNSCNLWAFGYYRSCANINWLFMFWTISETKSINNRFMNLSQIFRLLGASVRIIFPRSLQVTKTYTPKWFLKQPSWQQIVDFVSREHFSVVRGISSRGKVTVPPAAHGGRNYKNSTKTQELEDETIETQVSDDISCSSNVISIVDNLDILLDALLYFSINTLVKFQSKMLSWCQFISTQIFRWDEPISAIAYQYVYQFKA